MTKKTVALLILSLFAWSCGSETVSNVKNSNANTTASPDAARDTITIAERPQKVKDQMAARGRAGPGDAYVDGSSPSRRPMQIVNSSTVKVKLNHRRRPEGLQAAHGSRQQRWATTSTSSSTTALRSLLQPRSGIRAAKRFRRRAHAPRFSVAALA